MNLDLEKSLKKDLIAGIDEAGRGPWAGPVVAAACILIPDKISPDLLACLNDSKKLSAKKRDAAASLLHNLNGDAVHFGIGEASEEEIDSLNILQATFLAMGRAVKNLSVTPEYLLVDGNLDPKLGIPTTTVIKGDSISASIAAASILAKTHRDRVMENLAQKYPQYGWEKNAGYGTKDHQNALADFGITTHHRKSFKPIKALIAA